MKQKQQRTYNWSLRENMKQKFVSPSMTVPDETFTVKEILARFTRGLDPMITRISDYDNEQINTSLDEREFAMNPIRMIEDLSDIEGLKEILETTKRAIEKAKVKKDAEVSATEQ